MNGRRILRLGRVVGASLLAVMALAAGARAASTPAAAPKDVSLNDDATFAYWAYVARIATIYSGPSAKSHAITRLHWYTEDNFPEIYLLLRAHWDSGGREWIELRIPGRPNGRVGWVRRPALARLHLTHDRVVVNRGRLRMYFYTSGRPIWSAPVAVGKPSTPSPAGHFWIREKFKLADPNSGYYPFAFGTSDYSTLSEWPRGGVVGIHGPYFQPQLIPGHISHGCIRLRVADDAWLGQHLKYGTPLDII